MTQLHRGETGGKWLGHHIEPGYSAAADTDFYVATGEAPFETVMMHAATRTLLSGLKAMMEQHLDLDNPIDYDKLVQAMRDEQAKGRII